MTSKKPRALTPKEAAFVTAYLETSSLAEAARRAYGSKTAGSASSVGWTVKNRPHVAEAIKRELEAKTLGADEVLARLSDHARADMSAYITLDQDGHPVFDLEALKDDGKGALIKEIKVSPGGVVTFRLHDAQSALDKLAKIHGLYKERVEVSGPNGGPVQMEVRHDFDVEQLAEVGRILDECGAFPSGAGAPADAPVD